MEATNPLPIEYAHLVEPPILDFLSRDAARDSFFVTFIPDDQVSSSETEVVEIGQTSNEGQRIALQLDNLCHALGLSVSYDGHLDQIVHSGGAEFGLKFKGGSKQDLPDDDLSKQTLHDIYRSLQDIAMTAQVEFVMRKRAREAAPV